MTTADDLRYPIGRFDGETPVTPERREQALAAVADLPRRVRAAVAGLTDRQLDTPYRPGGWTVRQVVHHLADSHMNGFVRTKLGLTEDRPTIKPYDQDLWAPLADARLPIEASLAILDGVHARWAALWRACTPDDLRRVFDHPEIGPMSLDAQLQLYGWHSLHHVAHIVRLREREGWREPASVAAPGAAAIP